LRKRTFTSIGEVNHAFCQKVDILNVKRYKGSDFSRRELFEKNEQRLLKRLLANPFVLKSVSKATVQPNYHIELRSIHEYFSVPYVYAGKRVNVLWDNHSLEVYLDNKRIAVHNRTGRRYGKYNTLLENMPANHVKATELRGLSEEKLIAMARKVGHKGTQIVSQVIKTYNYPQQAFKSCNAILLLQKQYGKERLESACVHALATERCCYIAVKNILKSGLDNQLPFSDGPTPPPATPPRDNVRGSGHYS